MTQSLFYFLSFVAVMCGFMVVVSKNPVHSVLYLIITFFAIAGHFILLNAQFLAVVHIIVYAGAIMVLFVFVIMLLNLNAETEPHKPLLVKIAAFVSAGLLFLVLIATLRYTGQNTGINKIEIGLVYNLGKVLFEQFLLPFEISSILFLAAMIGAVAIGKTETKK